MGVTLFLGCALISLSPAAIIFCLTIAPHANLVVLCIFSAFMWVLSISAVSLAALLFPPVTGGLSSMLAVTAGVFSQELGRYLYYVLCAEAERRSVAMTSQTLFAPNSYDSILAGGVGFGAASVFVMYGSSLELTLQPGTLYTETCYSMSFFFSSAVLALIMFYFNIFAMVIATRAYRVRSGAQIFMVFLLHLAASFSCMFNSVSDGCVVSVPFMLTVLLVTGGWAFKITLIEFMMPAKSQLKY